MAKTDVISFGGTEIMVARGAIIGLIMVSVVLGCKKKSGDDVAGPSSQNQENTPNSSEEALANLSESQKQSFNQWKVKPFKACDPGEAFGLEQGDDASSIGVDLKEFLKQNRGSSVVIGNEQAIIFSGYRTFVGSGSTKVERSWEVNGRRIQFQAETKRDGSKCELFLFGQKVHEAFVVEAMTIGAHWLSGRGANAVAGRPEINPIGGSGKSEANRHEVFTVIRKVLTPSKEAQEFLAETYGLSKDHSSRLFSLSERLQIEPATRLEQAESSTIWSDESSRSLIAATDALNAAFAGTGVLLPVEVRLKIPSFVIQDSQTNPEQGTVKLIVPIRIAKRNDSSFEYGTQQAEYKGTRAFDRDEAIGCMRDRALTYRESSGNQTELRPSVDFMMEPCRSLSSDVGELSYESGLMKMLLPAMFARVSNPSGAWQYGGWDDVLIDHILQAFTAGNDPLAELDPARKTVVIGDASGYLISINRQWAQTRNLENSKTELLKMGIRWALRGFRVDDTKIKDILDAADNTMATFEVSTKSLLSELAANPNSPVQQDELEFAQRIDSTYKAEATKALGLASELQYEAFQTDVFNRAIQKRVKVEEWTLWSTRLAAIKAEMSPFQNLGSSRSALVGLSLKWLNGNVVEISGLASIYAAIDNVIVPFEVSTKKLLQDLASSWEGSQQSLAFSRIVTPEFKNASLSILGLAKSVGFADWATSFFDSVLQKMPSLQQLNAWKSLWMEAQGFQQREAARIVGESAPFNETYMRQIIERALDENWSPANFSALESIAVVARAKNTCGRHKGISSLADCAGMSAFSNKTGKFFDPNFSGRYVSLAKDFDEYFKQMTAHEWTTLRWTLVGEFFGSFEPIWSRCDDANFSSRAELLRTQVGSILQETDQIRRWEIERKMKENIENCR